MKVLVACEFSGIVRDMFISAGHDAISCDLLPSERPGPHLQQDVSPLLCEFWDMVIAFPPCTRLCNSGVRWLHERNLWEDMKTAAFFFKQCLNANAPKVAVENPVMHRYALSIVGRKPDFTIQPWQFGHGESKRTCFWTKNLPKLQETKWVGGRRERSFNESPGKNRWKNRSRTYVGIAEAMKLQWG